MELNRLKQVRIRARGTCYFIQMKLPLHWTVPSQRVFRNRNVVNCRLSPIDSPGNVMEV